MCPSSGRVQVEVDGRTEMGWKVGRGMDGITNLGAPRGTGPGGRETERAGSRTTRHAACDRDT
jgi:hypothetical protein